MFSKQLTTLPKLTALAAARSFCDSWSACIYTCPTERFPALQFVIERT